MIILTIRTDKPESEIGLYDDDRQIAYVTWQAHRQLAETIHHKIAEVVGDKAVDAVAVYRGPGSFTGLRIGIATANALAYGWQVPIVSGSGDDWYTDAMKSLINRELVKFVTPEYGAPVHITQQRK